MLAAHNKSARGLQWRTKSRLPCSNCQSVHTRSWLRNQGSKAVVRCAHSAVLDTAAIYPITAISRKAQDTPLAAVVPLSRFTSTRYRCVISRALLLLAPPEASSEKNVGCSLQVASWVPPPKPPFNERRRSGRRGLRNGCSTFPRKTGHSQPCTVLWAEHRFNAKPCIERSLGSPWVSPASAYKSSWVRGCAANWSRPLPWTALATLRQLYNIGQL
ncbi:hypothetical protein LMH87_002650 [Akanthomyces muscarius]|uniref:Uncharacterized protein n=1 Tax=Akanthomyces muscarius TaxID=2231603 RepID=A0A9W8Q766_AKAMU|nr:hypothetical protein LMH87_002650 [Akanthomyces muscarius]KAJ4148169.1 hypothetical protein LMH87_002650 [Akanthomyces muscarius]